jgi:hypothetical protein
MIDAAAQSLENVRSHADMRNLCWILTAPPPAGETTPTTGEET